MPAVGCGQWKRSPLSVNWRVAANNKASEKPILEPGLTGELDLVGSTGKWIIFGCAPTQDSTARPIR
jgi:hypothetical protein